MLAFRDFAPREVKVSWDKGSSYETFDAAVDAANSWIEENAVAVLHVETVVLPNVLAPHEEGTTDGSLSGMAGWANWNQFVRIWYTTRK